MNKILLALLLFTQISIAETLTNEGVQGEVDKERRGPVVTVEPIRETGQVRILADAYTSFKDYEAYPMKFEFYVNRELKLTQIRSKELSGPVGITIPESMATVPFNYGVVVTLLSANKSYSTFIAGAVYEKTFGLTAPCSASFQKSDGTTESFSNLSSEFKQSGPGTLSFDIELKGSPEFNELDLSGDIALDSSAKTLTSSVTTSIDGEVKTHESTGTYAESDSGSISEISLKSSDGLLTLTCK